MVCPCSSWYFTRLAKQETLPEPFPKINTSATRVAASGRNWPLPASGRKWPQVAAFCDFNFHTQSNLPARFCLTDIFEAWFWLSWRWKIKRSCDTNATMISHVHFQRKNILLHFELVHTYARRNVQESTPQKLIWIYLDYYSEVYCVRPGVDMLRVTVT